MSFFLRESLSNILSDVRVCSLWVQMEFEDAEVAVVVDIVGTLSPLTHSSNTFTYCSMIITAQKGSVGQAIVNRSHMIFIEYQLKLQRYLWNTMLKIEQDYYHDTGKFIFYNEMASLLTEMRSRSKLNRGICAAQQQLLKQLESALIDSFPSAKNRKGFPKYKKAKQDNVSLTLPASKVKILRRDGMITHISLPKLGLIKINNLRVPDGLSVNSVTFRIEGRKVLLSTQYAEMMEVHSKVGPTIGLDVGLSRLVATSDREIIAPPQFGRKAERRIKVLNKALSRKKKHSVNWRRSKIALSRRHARIRHLRENHQHQISRRLVDRAGTVAIEKLGLKALKRTHLGKSFGDAALGNLLNKIRYKALWAGVAVYEHPRGKRSTGCCPPCGTIGPKLPLGVETWTCVCGAIHDRDEAAAQWLERCAKMVGAASPEPAEEVIPSRRKRGFADMRSKVTSLPENHIGPPTNVLFDARQRASAG